MTSTHENRGVGAPVTDPDLFFPVSGSSKSLEQIERAKAICASCPVRRRCLAFALRTAQAHGIWGGRTEEERREPATADPVQPAAPAPGRPASPGRCGLVG